MITNLYFWTDRDFLVLRNSIAHNYSFNTASHNPEKRELRYSPEYFRPQQVLLQQKGGRLRSVKNTLSVQFSSTCFPSTLINSNVISQELRRCTIQLCVPLQPAKNDLLMAMGLALRLILT